VLRVLIALLALAPGVAAQSDVRRSVLLLLPDPPGRPNSAQVLEGVQATLRAADPGIAFSVDYLAQEGQGRPELVATQLAWYREKYRSQRFDAIIVLGPETLISLLRVRDDLWPDVPVIFCGSGPDGVPAALIRPGVTGTFLNSELTDNLKIIQHLLPGTRHIALVGGSSNADRSYNLRVPDRVRRVFPSIDIIDLTQLTIAELKTRVAALPPDTAVLIESFFYDRAGWPVFRPELVAALGSTTNSPIFSPSDNALGAGIVGGQLTHFAWVGARAAEIALRVLHGESASSIPAEPSRSSSLQFDWRQLKRWHIPLDRLPPNSEILYRPFSVWDQYWWVILLMALGAVLESILVAVLFVQRRRARETEAARQQAELEAAAARDEISHLNRVASMGELAASLAHELNQPLAAILANAQAAERFLDQGDPDLTEARGALADIREDDSRASEIIRRIRRMLTKQPMSAEAIDVNAAVGEVLSLLRTDAAARSVTLEFDPSPETPTAMADLVQVRQVIMNLVLNGMEALDGPGQVMVRTLPGALAGEVEILVADSGAGVPPELAGRIFEPFFSTKKDGLGMGLSIISSILAAHAGRIVLESGAVAGFGGATFRITLPAAREVVHAANTNPASNRREPA